MGTSSLIFFVNGVKIVDTDVDPEITLLRYLREKLKLPGTKLGCGEGGCGACTVMVSRVDRNTGKVEHISANACLLPVVFLHGMAVVTVEGIGSTTTRLHPIQERIAKSHGSQCGFCTPGFVMSMYALLRTDPNPSLQNIEENLVGNLCRCTGYRPIIEGLRTFSSSEVAITGCGRKDCCKLNGRTTDLQNEGTTENGNGLENGKYIPLDSTQEVIFPPELKIQSHEYDYDFSVIGKRVSYYRPTSLSKLLEIKQQFPQSKLVCGNTEIGIEVKARKEPYPILINCTSIMELTTISKENEFVEIGACATLSQIEETFRKLIKQSPESKVRTLKAVVEMLRWFAGKQIRNVATIGGNLMTSSPISDLIPILVAAKAKVVLQNADSSRIVVLDTNFFTGYRKNIAFADEVLTSIRIPYNNENEFFYAFKQSRRKDDDIAIVNAAMSVEFYPTRPVVRAAILAFGGMAATVVVAPKAADLMKEKEWNDELLTTGISTILEELRLHPSVVGGMAKYRQTLTASLFYKYFLTVKGDLNKIYPAIKSLTKEEENAIKDEEYRPPQSWQLYDRTEGENRMAPVGTPIVHLSAYKQTSGEATYVDDMPPFSDELYAGFVTSTKANAKIVSIDEAEALKMDGVRAFFCARDIPAHRNHSGVMNKEEIFASKKVMCVGQVIGIIVADNKQQAQSAAKAVTVTYEQIDPPILTIEEAIERNTVFGQWKVENGNLEKGFLQSKHTLEGEIKSGGQEHFYIETICNLIVPSNEGALEMFCTAQHPNMIQSQVAFGLGIPQTKVNCRVKRIGGGFGGKETRPLVTAIPMAIAAYKLKKPIRCMLDRDEDMQMTSGRHAMLTKWKVGFDDDGKIQSLQVDGYANSGCTMDLTVGVVTRYVLTFGNSYSIPNAKITVYGCRTDLPTATAFRGFGGTQAQLAIDDILVNVASFLRKPLHEVIQLNLISPGEKIINGKYDEDCSLKRCWDDVILQSDFQRRLRECNEFNRGNKLRKRGIVALPSKYAIGFGDTVLNQSGAVVRIYVDGSVLVSHGGVEMGQGLHTKMIQVASKALDVPIEHVSTMETATYDVPNTSATAASLGSDLNGMAVLNACTQLKQRLQPYRKQCNNNWIKTVMAAYNDRVCLFAEGFYKIPNISDVDYETGTGGTFSYFSNAAAVTEVEIDCLTGHHKVLQTDIVMDVGNSLNPAIDIGQVEGAFIQGMGSFTTEELLYTTEGALITKGPGAYKIPSILDIPRKFNVSLLKNSPNLKAVYSSRAVGEPPLVLASSVFFAIRQAIEETLPDKRLTRFDAPATVERIRLACKDWITDQVPSPAPGSYKPWGIGI